MNVVTLVALMDELNDLEKSAGFSRDLGTRIAVKGKAIGAQALQMAKQAPGWAQGQVQGGIRNMGGAVSAFANPIKSIGEGAKQLKSSSKAFKALTALNLYSGGRDAISKNDPTGQGRGRGERVGAFLGDQVGGLIGAPYGLGGGIVASAIGNRIGKTTGKVVDAVRGRKKNPRFDTMGDQPTAAMPQIDMK